MRTIRVWMRLSPCVFALLLGWNMGFAATVYDVLVDTVPLNGRTGFVDLQFNPGDVGTLGTSASVSAFRTDGTMASSADRIGGASGLLPGPPDVVIDNVDGLNDLFQGTVFGTEIRFLVSFAGLGMNGGGTSGSVFAFSLYDSDGFTPLLTSSPDGSVFHIDVRADGSTIASTFSALAAVAAVPVGSIPEPATWSLLAGGMCLFGAMARRRRGKMYQGNDNGCNNGCNSQGGPADQDALRGRIEV